MGKPFGAGGRRRKAAPVRRLREEANAAAPGPAPEAPGPGAFPRALIRAGEAFPGRPEGLRRLVEAAFEGLTENTLRAYRKAWDDFARHAGAGGRDEAARMLALGGPSRANELALTWRSALLGRGLSTSTISLRLAALRSIVSRLRLTGALSFEIEVRAPRVQGYRDTAGPGKEKILSAIEALRRRKGRRGLRDYALVHLLWSCALRVNEAASLDLEHLDLERGRAFILAKGRRDREPVDVPPGARAALEGWIRARGRAPGPVFTSGAPGGLPRRLTARQVRRITHGLGLGRPHGVRHTAITEALEATRDPRLVQRFSRHRDLATVMVYDDNRRRLGGEVALLLDRQAAPRREDG